MDDVLSELEDLTVGGGAHMVLFHRGAEALAREVASFLGAGLASGGQCLVVARPEHYERFAEILTANGVDLTAATTAGRLNVLDATAVLQDLVVDDEISPVRFDAVIGGLVKDLLADGGPLRVYGEMVSLLTERGRVEQALELEDLWNRLGAVQEFTLLCGYSTQAWQGVGSSYEQVCLAHSSIVTARREAVSGDDEAVRVLEGVGSSGEAALRFVREMLSAWEIQDLLAPIELVVGELAGHAIRYGGGRFRLLLQRLDDGVRVGLTHGIRQGAPPVAPSSNGSSLYLLEAFARSWHVDWLDGGLTIWAEFHLDG
jgi:hypothetical protein